MLDYLAIMYVVSWMMLEMHHVFQVVVWVPVLRRTLVKDIRVQPSTTTCVFNQDDIANYETEGKGYNMLNMGLAYDGQINAKAGYQLYAKANNLLDSKVYLHESFLSDVPQIGRNFMLPRTANRSWLRNARSR